MAYLQNNKIFLVFLSAFLTGISQHFQSLGFLSWFSLVPLFFVFIQIQSYKKIIKYSFLWGIIYNLISVYWIALNIGTNIYIGALSMIITVLILSVNTILIGVFWFKIKQLLNLNAIYALPVVWVSIEYLRSYGVLGFPWISLANTQTAYFYLIQNSEYVGIYGISFWIVMVNVFVYKLICQPTKKYLYRFLLTLILPFISGFLILRNVQLFENNEFQASLIQRNINLDDKWNANLAKKNFDNLIAKTKTSINEGSKLIIWPESALPSQYGSNHSNIKALFKENNVHLLLGDVTRDNDKLYNSSVLLNKDGVKQIYNKKQLVPMGEYVPFSKYIKILQNINLGQGNFSSGIDDVIFNIDNNTFSSLICFESTFPDINRIHAKKGADFFVYLVNDGWYTTIPEPRQHAKQSIYRAIENRRSVLRCANTGLSMVVSPLGEILNQTQLNKEDRITTFISRTNTITFYTKYGNVFAYLMLLITMILLFYSIYRNEKNN